MLSIVLNIITILIVFFMVNLFLQVYKSRKNKSDTASDVLKGIFHDPLVTGRAYFSESKDGPINDFMGINLSGPEDNGLHGFSHKKA
jgi:hypothetical protein